jgi:hypothetical protein
VEGGEVEPVNRLEAAWLSGIFEAEGSVHVVKTGRSIVVDLNMTDHDIILRIQSLAGGYVAGPRYPKEHHFGKKPFWSWRVYGWDNVERLYALIGPRLHARRRQQFEDAISKKPSGYVFVQKPKKGVLGKMVPESLTD